MATFRCCILSFLGTPPSLHFAVLLIPSLSTCSHWSLALETLTLSLLSYLPCPCCLCHGPHVPAIDACLSLRGYYGAYQPLGFRVTFTRRASLPPQKQHPQSVLCPYQLFWFLHAVWPMVLPSFSTQVCFPTVLFQVVFGLPLVLRPLEPILILKQSFSPSLLSMWPSLLHLLCRNSLTSSTSSQWTTISYLLLAHSVHSVLHFLA